MSMLSTSHLICEAMVPFNGLNTGMLSQEVAYLKKENTWLKIVNDKQWYRIELLVGNLKKKYAVANTQS